METKVICDVADNLTDCFCKGCHHSTPHNHTEDCEEGCEFYPAKICRPVVL